ncbi:glycine cleavage system T protein [Nemania sp. FL0916]|nr:glycine cleavage system T protein [Nemania sp. FL0916]
MHVPRAISTAGRGIRTLGSSRSPNSALVRALSSSAAASSTITTSTASTTTTTITPIHSRQARSTHLRPQTYPQTLAPQNRRTYSAGPASKEPLKRTALYDLHLAHGAKMVPFGGYEMPVQYSGQSVSESHKFTREKASLFDVGHMVQHRFEGAGAAAFLERITPGSIGALPRDQSTLSAFLWPGTGGIVDDTVITRTALDRFYVVTNAACRDKDLDYLRAQLGAWDGPDVRHWVLEDRGLVALQGPLAAELLALVLESQDVVKALPKVLFGQSVLARLKGTVQKALITRTGYTGEDGFEISLDNPRDTVAATEALLAEAGPERLQFAGLGARDSLRLEAGMCLYGHDLDDTTTPVEAGLAWIVGKDRRSPTSDAQKFHGADIVLPQTVPKSKGGSGVARRRVGLFVEDGPVAREGAKIHAADDGEVGVVTSGCPSPTLGRNIAMAYVRDGLHKQGTELQVLVRGKSRKAVVTKMPFVPAKYWKGTAPA